MPAKKKRTALPGGAPVSAKKKKPKRAALPGGAPLPKKKTAKKKTAKRPGGAPPKAASSGKSRARAKPPCKYGPRGADGYCPKKPKSARARATVTARSVEGASRQATDVILNPKATKEQKIEAVTKVAEAAAIETVKTTAKTVYKKREAIKKALPAIGAAVQSGAAKAGAAAAPIGAAVAGGYVASKLMTGRIRKEAEKMLADTIRRTPPGLRHQFTPEVRAKLLDQYSAHIRKRNEILFTK